MSFIRFNLSFSVLFLFVLQTLNAANSTKPVVCNKKDKVVFLQDEDGDRFVRSTTPKEFCPGDITTGYVARELARVDASKKLIIDCNDVPLSKAVVDKNEKIKIDGRLRNTLLKYNMVDLNCNGNYFAQATDKTNKKFLVKNYQGSIDPKIVDGALFCGNRPKFKLLPDAEIAKLQKENEKDDLKGIAAVSEPYVIDDGYFSDEVEEVIDPNLSGMSFAKTCIRPSEFSRCIVPKGWRSADDLPHTTEKIYFPTGVCFGDTKVSVNNKCENVGDNLPCNWGDKKIANGTCAQDAIGKGLMICAPVLTHPYGPKTEFASASKKSLRVQFYCNDSFKPDDNYLLMRIIYKVSPYVSPKSSSWFFVSKSPVRFGYFEKYFDVPDALGVITNSGTLEIQMKTVQIEDNNYASVDDPANKNHSKLRSLILDLAPRTIASASSSAQVIPPQVTAPVFGSTLNPGIDEGANSGSYGNATSNSSSSSIPTIDNGTITSSSSEDSSISDYLSNNPGQDSSSSSEDSGENYCCRTLDYRFEACGDINRSVPADMCCQDKSRDAQGQDHKKLSEEIASAEKSVQVWRDNVWVMNAANYFVQGSALATDMFRCPEKTIDDLPTVRSLGTLADYIKKKALEGGRKEIAKLNRDEVFNFVEKNLGTSSKIDASAPMERALIHATQDYVASKCDAFVATGKLPNNVVKEVYGWMEKSMKHSLKITQQRSDDAQRRLTELYKELEDLGPDGERQTNISEWAMCMQSFQAPSPAKYK